MDKYFASFRGVRITMDNSNLGNMNEIADAIITREKRMGKRLIQIEVPIMHHFTERADSFVKAVQQLMKEYEIEAIYPSKGDITIHGLDHGNNEWYCEITQDKIIK